MRINKNKHFSFCKTMIINKIKSSSERMDEWLVEWMNARWYDGVQDVTDIMKSRCES